MDEEKNNPFTYIRDGNDDNPFIFKPAQTPLYERPGRLDPDRNVPITRQDRVDVNVHYDAEQKTFVKDSDKPSPEFTEQSVNALDPFEDTALLQGEVKPKVVGIRKGMPKIESRIFVPETDVEDVRAKVRKPAVPEPEQPLYISEEDAAASTDYIADAFSGVETAAKDESVRTVQPSEDIAKLKMYTLLLGVVIVLEITGIAIIAIL
ncbi:MAG: hypothetical protein IKG03_03240 [Clostridiales bacterium]|nr:hypothetical protein [Clostridiales bacterium]